MHRQCINSLVQCHTTNTCMIIELCLATVKSADFTMANSTEISYIMCISSQGSIISLLLIMDSMTYMYGSERVFYQ